MAKMFPENYPDGGNLKDPEYEVFQLLRQLPDRFTVIHSKKLKGGRNCKEETEIDFLIFDGAANLICLEVKGGELAYSGPDSCWYQNGVRMKRSPDRQASAACHAMIEFLGNDANEVNINWALAFPDCSRPAGSGRIPEVPDDLVLDSQALLQPTDAIDRICRYNEQHLRRSGVRRHQASHILERLLRSVGFVTKIGVRLIQDNTQLVKATEQQLEILEDLELNERTAVMGYAGTGKTIIATEFAKRSAERGQKVLLMFYNRMVANTVRYGLGHESPIECATFHSLARRVIEASDAAWWNTNANKDDQEFWETDVPLKMLEALEMETPIFDVIIVDEGQDLKPEWYETLEKLLIQNEKSRYVVFYDGNQDIFGRWKSLPWQPHAYTKKNLRKNCRNTKAIINYLNEIISSDMVAFEQSPEGVPVEVRNTENQDTQARAIREGITLLLKEGVPPGQIVILIDSQLKESAVAKIDQIGKHKLSWMGKSYRPESHKIQISTIDSFKGLEADVVFVILGENSERDTRPHKLYTQVSRARLLLHLYTIL
jgi:hypothetical protein